MLVELVSTISVFIIYLIPSVDMMQNYLIKPRSLFEREASLRGKPVWG